MFYDIELIEATSAIPMPYVSLRDTENGLGLLLTCFDLSLV
jgi:hypothetical protein